MKSLNNENVKRVEVTTPTTDEAYTKMFNEDGYAIDDCVLTSSDGLSYLFEKDTKIGTPVTLLKRVEQYDE